MRLVASTPNSKPVPEAIRDRLAAISQDDLREVVERISVPRPTGTTENEAVRRSIIELFSGMETGHLGVGVDDAGNVVVGDPRRAKILIGAHYDSILGTPGADDNASGMSALLATARAIGPEEGLSYVAFDGEECGFVGSRARSPGWGSTIWSRSTSWRWSVMPAGSRAHKATPFPPFRPPQWAIFLAWSARTSLGGSWIMSWTRHTAMPSRSRASSCRTCRWR